MRHRSILITLAAALVFSLLLAGSSFAQGQQADREPPGPAPRLPDGRVSLGAMPDEKGLWLGAFAGMGTPGSQAWPLDSIPWQPWARGLYVYRQTHELEPHARCKMSGITRQFQTPYSVEIVDLPELQRIFIFDVGGPHSFRIIHMDGRTHPKDLEPSGYGHSIGWWEGDTLVVDTTGFSEDFWLDRRGIPHTENLRTIERFTRTDFNTIRYEVTFEDPFTFTEPWTGSFNLSWRAGEELFEYICQQSNYAHELMLGHYESMDRSSRIVP